MGPGDPRRAYAQDRGGHGHRRHGFRMRPFGDGSAAEARRSSQLGLRDAGHRPDPGHGGQSSLRERHRRLGPQTLRHQFADGQKTRPQHRPALRAFAPPGSKVLMATPIYNAFYFDLYGSKLSAAESIMKMVNGRYEIDWDDFEKKASDPAVKTTILCNPHNPVGRVWSKDELH